MTDIRTDENLVEVVAVREKPDRDPAEEHVADVWIWQRGGLVEVDVRGPQAA